MPRWKVRPVNEVEFDAWSALFRGYAEFYEWPTSAGHQRQIWDWIHRERRIECLVVVPVDGDDEVGPPVGLAHLRTWVRPLRGVECWYLDDLFVDPETRGAGAVDALFAHIITAARDRRYPVVRWTTAEDNERAQRVYDRYATRTTWVTYDLSVDA